MTDSTERKILQIAIPVYNDWESVGKLLPQIDAQLVSFESDVEVILADDASPQLPPDDWSFNLKRIRTIRILRLTRNLGHQRAICVALCEILKNLHCTHVLVMDGDGEDAPSDIPQLLRALEDAPRARIAFAERTKRSEGWLFSAFYVIYKFLHRILVGHRIRVGNFSVLTRDCLQSLCSAPELWNHYAASAFATKQTMTFVPTHRAKRLEGRSQMNFTSLVMHGLSALSVFSDRINTRLLILSAGAIGVTVFGMGLVALIRFGSDYAIPGWATSAFGIFVILLVQIATFVFMFTCLILFTRGLSSFIPIRDYIYYVHSIREIGDESESSNR